MLRTAMELFHKKRKNKQFITVIRDSFTFKNASKSYFKCRIDRGDIVFILVSGNKDLLSFVLRHDRLVTARVIVTRIMCLRKQ